MNKILEGIERLASNLARLGPARLTILGLVGTAIFLALTLSGYYVSRPSQEVLYAGLERQDASRVAAALQEAGIAFDVSADGGTVFVRYGQSPQARMLLAEKGLPNGASAGYELFDKLGSLGLTSFMQEVTRVRAMEGELARTIQLIRGVKAARVHIVLPEEGSFRRVRQPPSASVIIRTEGRNDIAPAAAIRHLVASAIPGMKTESVTVISSDGTLLASQDDGENAGSGRAHTLERSVAQEIEDNIRKTLAPYLSVRNFQISVAARLNTDKRQTNETIFNPESRVERSVRVTKETITAQNSTQQAAATVERNLPQDNARANNGKQSNEDTQKREELTNYEVSSKTVTTVSGGYSIEGLSVALTINRASLLASLGDKATPEALTAQLGEIEQLVASAAGIKKERGDTLKISAFDFVDSAREFAPAPPMSFLEQISRQSGSLVNSGVMLLITALILWFGLRPLTKALLRDPVLVNPEPQPLLAGSQPQATLTGPDGMRSAFAGPEDVNLIGDIAGKPLKMAQKRLEQIIEFDEDRAAAVLRQWIQRGNPA